MRPMHPYREFVPPARTSKATAEDLVLYGLLIVIGMIPVVIALLQDATFGVDATLGALMVCTGAVGAIRYARRARASRNP